MVGRTYCWATGTAVICTETWGLTLLAVGGWVIQADAQEIELFNPCFDVADIDGDGDWDLFGAAQSGQVYLYENIDKTELRTKPTFAGGTVIANDGKYLVNGGHPRVTVADFTGDGLFDLVIDRAWGLVDLDNVLPTREFAVMLKNVGTATAPKWQKTGADGGAPFTETFQTCDAVRQNVVRAVEVRIHDEPFPADRGARLFEVDAHH